MRTFKKIKPPSQKRGRCIIICFGSGSFCSAASQATPESVCLTDIPSAVPPLFTGSSQSQPHQVRHMPLYAASQPPVHAVILSCCNGHPRRSLLASAARSVIIVRFQVIVKFQMKPANRQFRVQYAAPGCIRLHYPRASHQPAALCLASCRVLLPFTAFLFMSTNNLRRSLSFVNKYFPCRQPFYRTHFTRRKLRSTANSLRS